MTVPIHAPTDRSAVVTGSTGGVGRAIAAKLADAGFAVVVAFTGAAEPADRLVEEIRATGRRAVAIAADVSDEPAVRGLFDGVESRLGPIDVVVHTAGINRAASLVDLDLWMLVSGGR